MKRMISIWLSLFLALAVFGCRATDTPAGQAPQSAIETEAAGKEPEADMLAGQTPALMPTDTPQSAAETAPDGKGVINFTIVLHLEGWDDGESEASFRRHAEQLREYADLFEKYGATITLESKEIIDGCLNWNDNVLFELQQRGHAIGIHADAGGENGATIRSIERTLTEMRGKLLLLGINATFASGVASKTNWVKACEDAEIATVSCMVAYGLWSLDESLRPEGFESDLADSRMRIMGAYLWEKRLYPGYFGDRVFSSEFVILVF